MNRDLSKFEPPKAEPDGLTKKLFGSRNVILTNRFGIPMKRESAKIETNVSNILKITCAACGSSNVSGHYDPRKRAWIITCHDCGVFMERPDVPEKTDLENEVDILNSYEKLCYQVNKSKEN